MCYNAHDMHFAFRCWIQTIFPQHGWNILSGVGGHGGNGIHADLEAKYQEVISRVATFASPSNNPPINLSNLNKKNRKKSSDSLLDSDFTLDNVPIQPLVIPGYVSDDRARVVHSAPSGMRQRNQADTPASAGSRQQAEQVHVPRCTVCNIL